MADTTPLTSTDTVTAVGIENTQLMMTQNMCSIFKVSFNLLLNSPITDSQVSTDCNTVGDSLGLRTN